MTEEDFSYEDLRVVLRPRASARKKTLARTRERSTPQSSKVQALVMTTRSSKCLAILSAAILFVTGVVWAWSYRRDLYVGWGRGPRDVSATVRDGVIRLRRSFAPSSGFHASPQGFRMGATPYRFYETLPPHGFGFTFQQIDFEQSWSWELFVPCWCFALAGSLFPGLWLFRRLRRQRLRRKCRCIACGYDLRATPDRCPECGATVAAEPR